MTVPNFNPADLRLDLLGLDLVARGLETNNTGMVDTGLTVLREVVADS